MVDSSTIGIFKSTSRVLCINIGTVAEQGDMIPSCKFMGEFHRFPRIEETLENTI